MRLAALLAAAVLLPWQAAACVIRAQTHIEPTPDGERFLLVMDRRRLKVVSRSGEVLGEAGADGPVIEAAISPDGKAVAFCPERRGLRVYAVGKGQPEAPEKAGDCSDLSWSADGATLAYVLARTQAEETATMAVVRAKLWTAAEGSRLLHEERIPVATWERSAQAELPPPDPGRGEAPAPPREEAPKPAPQPAARARQGPPPVVYDPGPGAAEAKAP